MMRMHEYSRVFVDRRGWPGWRVLLTAGRHDRERFRLARAEDPSAAEMMSIAFADAVVDFEDAAMDSGIRFGADISVSGSARAGTLQVIRRLTEADAMSAHRILPALEARFDGLLKHHFALADRNLGHACP